MAIDPRTRELRRLFFALWPPEEVRAAIEQAVQPLAARSAGRTIAARNYHITLAFLGGVPGSRVVQILKAAAATGAGSFKLDLVRVEFWPQSGVLCLLPASVPDALLHLVDTLYFRVSIVEPVHKFRPHVSLARDVSLSLPAQPIPAIPWTVRDFVLCESHRRPAGTTYEVLARWNLD